MGKLAMLMKCRLPVKVIIVKHTMRGMIALERIAYVENPQYGVQSKPIEFEAVPKGCGVPGIPLPIQRWWNAYYVKHSTIPIRLLFKLLLI
jgi:thiamine pyrophosphate-dependent acetolactate synthase large subunit-like protein